MDQIADLLARIKNGYLAHHMSVACPVSKIKIALLKILKHKRYLEDFEVKEKKIEIKLKYNGRESAIADIKRISKPGLRIYVGWRDVPNILSGIGTCILSTSKGLMTGNEAKKLKIGGELVCKIW